MTVGNPDWLSKDFISSAVSLIARSAEALSRLETKNTGETLQVEEHILQLQALKYFLSGSKPF